MPLPTSGSLTFSLVKTELGLGGTLSLGTTSVRNLAGKPSGLIKMSDLYGKSNFPPAGTILGYTCSGVDRFATKANGSGGTYSEIFEYNSTACGYVAHPPYGTFLYNSCVGFSYVANYADGNGGIAYYTTLENNSPTCGYVAPSAGSPSGAPYCSGTTKMQMLHDGAGGTYAAVIETNSVECGYVNPNPAAGTLLGGPFCEGLDKKQQYHDGNGGAYTSIIEANSPDCQPPPPPPPPPTFTAAGTPNGTAYCQGTDLYQSYHNGSGGFYEELVQMGAPECTF